MDRPRTGVELVEHAVEGPVVGELELTEQLAGGHVVDADELGAPACGFIILYDKSTHTPGTCVNGMQATCACLCVYYVPAMTQEPSAE